MIFRRVRKELVRVLCLAVVLYAAILIYVVATEDAQVFPAAYRERPDRVPELPEGFERITLTTADGEKIAAYRTHCASDAASRRWCLFFTGQWGRARWDKPKLDLLRELDCEVLTFDYRGYGDSTGKPSEAGFYCDADTAYDYLIKGLGVSPARMVLVAHSLGTGVAIDLATRSEVGGVIVDGAFDSIPACGAVRYPWLPVGWIARNRFDSVGKISRVTVPKLFLHGEFDESIPIERGRAVFAAASEPKWFVALEGRHEDFQWSDAVRFRAAVTEFMKRVSLP